MRNFARIALSVGAALLIAGCGESQPQTGAPGAEPQNGQVPVPQSVAAAPYHRVSHRATSYYRVVYRFRNRRSDGAQPYASLINVNGTLYGTTAAGGVNNAGTVFSVTTSGKERVLYAFLGGSDGASPSAGLTNVNGTLYGTTQLGGSSGLGTVFSVSLNGVEKVLHSFGGSGDGAVPYAGLTKVRGLLYGTTSAGGYYGGGTVFSVTTTGTEKVLHSFGRSDDGRSPYASLIYVNGTLYGTTYYGSSTIYFDGGTVFSMTTTGTEKILYSFLGGNSGPFGGEYPYANLINVNGTLYGTATDLYGDGLGAVFSVTTSGSERVLYRFCLRSTCSDGKYPFAGLVKVGGKLYGTTIRGGAYCGGGHNCGTVFSVTLDGTEEVLHSFGLGSDGEEPYASLINVHGTLYGTTTAGGTGSPCRHTGFNGCGTVFALTP